LKLNIKKILEICDGSLLCGSDSIIIENYSKDTRTIQKGDCYIGIRGESFDGNKYWLDAKEKGAVACILDSYEGLVKDFENFPIILVKDSVKAIQDLATYVRENTNIPVVAITGSVGKTSTKDMIASVLSEKYKVLKSPGNLNGQIGLPLNILSLKDEEIMVLEMGMNDFGQIKKLSHIAKPNIAVITNIGTAHIGLLGSRENILKAKLEILEGMEPGSTIILNKDNDILSTLNLPDYNVITCGMNKPADIFAQNIERKINESKFEVKENGKMETFQLPIMGDVFLTNSLLAIAVGRALNLSIEEIKKGLSKVELSGNRMEVTTLKNNITLINDTYNSNFEAVVSALNILKDYLGKRKIAVLGDILEMEAYEEEIHRKIGSLEVLESLDAIFLTGSASKYIYEEALKREVLKDKVFYYETNELLIDQLLSYIKLEDTVLLKASHGMDFSKIAEKMKKIFKK